MAEGEAGLDAFEVVLAEFGADFFLIPDEDEFDVGKITQGLNGSRDGIVRGEVPSHGVEGDFHPGRESPRN
jgi:hypothetical protein